MDTAVLCSGAKTVPPGTSHIWVHQGKQPELKRGPNSAKPEQPNAVIYSVKLHKHCSVPNSLPLPQSPATSNQANCET